MQEQERTFHCVLAEDASGGDEGGYGACLAQIDDYGQENPIAHASLSATKKAHHKAFERLCIGFRKGKERKVYENESIQDGLMENS